jgi:alcohol dehydrogenase, propanol-preferring
MAKSITEFRDVGLDVIVDFAGFGTTTADAVSSVRRHGRVVQVGMGRLESTINTKDLILGRVSLIGSAGGTKDDIAGVYRYFETGELDPVVTPIEFGEIADGLERLRQGNVTGRLVAEL